MKKETMQDFARRRGDHWDKEGYPILPLHNQPESSKREDSLICEEARNEFRKFLDETFDERINYCHQKELERCGTPNTMETYK